ncbi:hypothetical protein M426DRAFT_323250 [Hypoxylon sp. CI-4A]|nr:hypothetical protein M426DRAFT_323250 [Hypoxylon sp. CI-4A]
MRLDILLFTSPLLVGSVLAWGGPHARADPSASFPIPPPPPPTIEASSSSRSEATATAPDLSSSSTPFATASASDPSGSGGIGPKCGKGYTYCGYMLTSNGHNFGSTDISKAYCTGLTELCANGKPKTDVSEAVFVCMDEQPSSVQLLCACSGKCRNDADSNFIAHCDKPCING